MKKVKWVLLLIAVVISMNVFIVDDAFASEEGNTGEKQWIWQIDPVEEIAEESDEEYRGFLTELFEAWKALFDDMCTEYDIDDEQCPFCKGNKPEGGCWWCDYETEGIITDDDLVDSKGETGGGGSSGGGNTPTDGGTPGGGNTPADGGTPGGGNTPTDGGTPGDGGTPAVDNNADKKQEDKKQEDKKQEDKKQEDKKQEETKKDDKGSSEIKDNNVPKNDNSTPSVKPQEENKEKKGLKKIKIDKKKVIPIAIGVVVIGGLVAFIIFGKQYYMPLIDKIKAGKNKQ